MSALALGRQMLEGWNSGSFELVFATFDPDIVVRPDANWPEGVYFGRDSAERFWQSVRDNLGGSVVAVEEEHDLGDRSFWRVHQPVHSASGVESGFSWSFLVTARSGSVILVEFFIDDARIRAELGL
jgi:ketosteroid isomerase-like protein